MEHPVKIGGSYGSPYSMKMRAVLRYRRIPHQWIPRDSEFDDLPEPSVRLQPTLAFPDEMGNYPDSMVDSSPQIMRLEGLEAERSVVPADPALAFLDHLLEDFADEWCTKMMYHYRWHHLYPEAIQKAAGPLSSVVFAALLITGLIAALGFVDDTALDDLPKDVISFVPKALSAAIVLIVANIAATVVVAAVERSLGHVSATLRQRVPTALRGAILFVGGLMAANQLGVDTEILTLAAAAVFFGAALTAALVSYSGSGPVAKEVAARRALRSVLSVGDTISTEAITGTVAELHSVKVEVEVADGRRVLLPYTTLLESVVSLDRSGN